MSKLSISKMITKLRVAMGLTQEQFGARVGVTLSTVNRWENSVGKPSPLAMARIKELQNELEGVHTDLKGQIAFGQHVKWKVEK